MALATDLPAPTHLDSKHRDHLLFRRYQHDGDLHARRALIERYLPLARSLARR